MNIKSAFNTSSRVSFVAFTIVAFGFAGLALQAASEKKSDTSANLVSKKEKEYGSAKEAADALLHAAEVFDVAALREILGPDAADLIASADPVADKKCTQGASGILTEEPRSNYCTNLTVFLTMPIII